MKQELKYELPVYSYALEQDVQIEHNGLDIKINVIGYDDNNKLRKISILFKTVLCYKFTSKVFSPELYNSFDKIVELKNSEWLQELSEINKEEFDYWKLRHYVLYLADDGLFQFIANDFEVTEYD